MKALEIISPGIFTTVQDQGRFGFQRFGVPPCGMLDKWAGNLANILVGNEPGAAVLEFTFTGGQMEVLGEFTLAVTGGDMGLEINGKACCSWASHRVRRGDVVCLGSADTGCRTYMAVTGGIDVPKVMGSRSTYLGASMGGYGGRILAGGDVIKRGPGKILERSLKIPRKLIPEYGERIVLRAVPGPQDGYFDRGMEVFFTSTFTVTSRADRMGYRLEGPAVHRKKGAPGSIISEPSLPGGVQIPEDGQPIVLLGEQTVGGYAKIATVISPDIDRLAQAVPGNQIRFENVTLEQAHEIYRERARLLTQTGQGDLEVRTLASMGNDFFSHPVFIERLEKYMIQI